MDLYQAELAKLILSMGSSLGSRRKNNSIIPQQVEKAFNSYCHINPLGGMKEKYIAYDIMHDFILTLFFARADYNGAQVPLHPFDTKELSLVQAMLISKIANIIYPNLNCRSNAYPHDYDDGYSGHIRFNSEAINEIEINKLLKRRIENCIQIHRLAIGQIITP